MRYAEKRVAQLGIEVKLNTGLTAATADEAVLHTGERIPTRTIITCTGMKPSPLLEQFPYRRDKRGRLETDEFCRVPGAENFWAGGDCAAVPHSPTHALTRSLSPLRLNIFPPAGVLPLRMMDA